eukprot:3690402-Rhodomonas_salina.1
MAAAQAVRKRGVGKASRTKSLWKWKSSSSEGQRRSSFEVEVRVGGMEWKWREGREGNRRGEGAIGGGDVEGEMRGKGL